MAPRFLPPVTGSGTAFLTDFATGDSIIVGSAVQTVVAIAPNTSLTTQFPLNPVANASAYSIQKVVARFNTSAAAFPDCSTSFNNVGVAAHVCSHNEASMACGAGFDFYATKTAGWYGDITADNVFMTWNAASCVASGDNNGPATAYHGASLPWRCCYSEARSEIGSSRVVTRRV